MTKVGGSNPAGRYPGCPVLEFDTCHLLELVNERKTSVMLITLTCHVLNILALTLYTSLCLYIMTRLMLPSFSFLHFIASYPLLKSTHVSTLKRNMIFRNSFLRVRLISFTSAESVSLFFCSDFCTYNEKIIQQERKKRNWGWRMKKTFAFLRGFLQCGWRAKRFGGLKFTVS